MVCVCEMWCVCVRVCARVRACVCACMRACMRARVHECVWNITGGRLFKCLYMYVYALPSSVINKMHLLTT